MNDLNRYLKSKGLPSFTSIRKKVKPKDPVTGRRDEYSVEEQCWMPRGDVKDSKMIYLVQKFPTNGEGDRTRIGYYIIGRKGRFRGKWAWGQFCPWYLPKDFKVIASLLKRRHWF